jgi:23S rRNA pseudouridine2605 synthase
VRLNKYLASHGIGSRRRCDALIEEGAVMIDGEIVTELGTKVQPHLQRIEVDGVVLKPEGLRHRYYILNKPSGVVCTNDEREAKPRAVDLITDRKKGRIFSVGRLDEDTTGLLILTNDGDFAHRVMHPRYGVTKTYLVKLIGRITDREIDQVRDGVYLSDGKTAGARVLVKQRGPRVSKLEVTLLEGKNREVRRVFARVGHKVVDLKRIRIGPINDRGLKVGHWRPLTRPEVTDLLAHADPNREAHEAQLPGRENRGRDQRGRNRSRRGGFSDAGRGGGGRSGRGGQGRGDGRHEGRGDGRGDGRGGDFRGGDDRRNGQHQGGGRSDERRPARGRDDRGSGRPTSDRGGRRKPTGDVPHPLQGKPGFRGDFDDE